jgi:hypothetical protein
MAVKMEKIWLENSSQVMGLSSGLYYILEPVLVLHIVFLEVLSTVKKSLSLNIQWVVIQLSTRELLMIVITLRIRLGSLTMTARFQLMRGFLVH